MRINPVRALRRHTQEAASLDIEPTLKRFILRSQPNINPKYRSMERLYRSLAESCGDDLLHVSSDLQLFMTAWALSPGHALLPSDAKVLMPLAEILRLEEVSALRDCDPVRLSDAAIQRTIIKTVADIQKFLRDQGICGPIDDDAVATTILWGSTACILPYDPFVRKGMRLLSLSPDSLSVAGLRTIASYWENNKSAFERASPLLSDKGLHDAPLYALAIYVRQLGEEHLGL